MLPPSCPRPRRLRAILAALLCGAAPLLAQGGFDDSLWIAGQSSRRLSHVARSGAALGTLDLSASGFDLRGVWRAPDGVLWVIALVSTTPTVILVQGGSATSIPVASAGTPFEVAFDAAGSAYLSMANRGEVEQWSSAGVYLRTFRVAVNPIGLAVDNRGNVWVAHRTGLPGRLSRIQPATGVVTPFVLPQGSQMLPMRCVADGSLGSPSVIWVIGDGSNELVRLDPTTGQMRTVRLGTQAGLSDLAVDAQNHVWITNGATGDVFKVDGTGAPLFQFQVQNPVGVAMDSLGRPWVCNRAGAGGLAAATLLRRDLATGAQEVAVPVVAGANGNHDAGNFGFAWVVDPTGDADGDGTSNQAEVQGGTSPYDALSNPGQHLETVGPSHPGASITVRSSGAPAGVMVLIPGRARGPGLVIPGVRGELRLDPTRLLPLFWSQPLPGVTTLAIPNDPALVGAALVLQGVALQPSGAAFSNVDEVAVW